MKQIKDAINQMITTTEGELDNFLSDSVIKKFKKNEIISWPNVIPNEIYFINKGIIRVLINDKDGLDHTIYFAMENQFIADYSNFILKQSSLTSIQALEETELVIIPRESIEWGYANLKQGEKLGRVIAEFYFIYQDDKIKNQYARTATERYNAISTTFPNIHNRVPQHMIASYLGISPVHLSRLKKSEISKT
jgi:signal-transduction protein with cAMP-binding, CBS, and nucleotidyltransferase domain